MTSGALHSDHVNYLIFRYLQEAGHENAATAFSRDWHRPHEYRDPENYPWAPVVRRSELVSVIQSGLHHDELQSRVRKSTRKFQFTSLNSRESLERQDGGGVVLENGALVGSRPSSSAKRKARLQIMRAPDEFPTPPPKRKRRSEGSEGVHLNGERDVMEVDAASASADADEDGDAASPAVASETEVMEVPERYDSMDVAVQTEVKTGPKTSTMYWRVDKPDATILHSMFCPSSNPKDTRTFLAVGASLCRFYQVPLDVTEAEQVLSIEEPSLPSNSVVTATAWHPQGHTAVCALDGVRELQDDRQESQQTIISYNRDSGSSEYFVPPLLEPAGIILAMRYNAAGTYLLVLRMNLERSLVLVHDTSKPEPDSHQLVGWCHFDRPVFDMAWITERDFIVCGERGLVQLYRVTPDVPSNSEQSCIIENVAEAASSQGLTGLPLHISWDEDGRKWDKIRSDEKSKVLVLISSEHKRIAMGPTNYDEDNALATQAKFCDRVELPGQPTAVAFQPEPSAKIIQPPLLAIAFEDGSCLLYTYFEPWRSSERGKDGMEELLKIHLSEGPALALAWSHSGSHLAVAGTDLVQIWEAEALVKRDGYKIERNGALHRPIVTWRPDHNATGPRNGEHEEVEISSEPSLSWSADGESLAFAVEQQIAIIRFRPPLHSAKDEEEANGHMSL